MWIIKFAICVVFPIAVVFGNTCSNYDKGSLSSCYNSDGSVIGKTTLEIRWDPQNITGNHTYSITLEKLEAENGTVFDTGSLNLTVKIPGLDKPLYSKVMDYTCEKLLKDLHVEEYIHCPLTPQKFTFLINTTIPFPAPAEIPVPMGSYEVIASLTNKDDKKPFLCVDAWLIFADVHEELYTCQPPTPHPPDQRLSRSLKFVLDSWLGVQSHNDRERDNL